MAWPLLSTADYLPFFLPPLFSRPATPFGSRTSTLKRGGLTRVRTPPTPNRHQSPAPRPGAFWPERKARRHPQHSQHGILTAGQLMTGMDAHWDGADDRFPEPHHSYFARLSERPHVQGHCRATWHDTAQRKLPVEQAGRVWNYWPGSRHSRRARHKGSNLQSTLQCGAGRPDLSSARSGRRNQPKYYCGLCDTVRQHGSTLEWTTSKLALRTCEPNHEFT